MIYTPNMIDACLNRPEFNGYPKTKRLDDATFVISEKIDGSNGVIHVDPYTKAVTAGSRSKWLGDDGSKSWDNHGFGEWVKENTSELQKLPAGIHYGEWYGRGINRNYGLKERKFMLFDRKKYQDLPSLPECVELETLLTPELSIWFLGRTCCEELDDLKENGSRHVPGFMKPEGIIVRFKSMGQVMKVILDK